MIQPPPGGQILTPDEAAEALITGDHPEVDTGDLAIDGTLIDAIRAGEIIAARLADGRLAFTRVP